jgi:hypothetical protein
MIIAKPDRTKPHRIKSCAGLPNYYCIRDGSRLICDVCGSDACTSAVVYPEGKFYCSGRCEEKGEGVTIVEVEINIVGGYW